MVNKEAFEEEVEAALEEAEENFIEETVDSATDINEMDEAPRDIAEAVVEDHDITTTDYIVYQSKMDKRGVDREKTKELWEQLRDERIIESENDTDEGVEKKDMEAPDLGDVNPADIAELHLFVVEECDACEAAKEQMSDLIERGDVTLQNISTDDSAVMKAEEADLNEAPVLLAEMDDGTFEKL